jgi:hypothetical protein
MVRLYLSCTVSSNKVLFKFRESGPQAQRSPALFPLWSHSNLLLCCHKKHVSVSFEFTVFCFLHWCCSWTNSILINFTKVFMLVQIRDSYQFTYYSVNNFCISGSHMIKFSCIQTRPEETRLFYMGYNMRTEQAELNNRPHNIDIILGW